MTAPETTAQGFRATLKRVGRSTLVGAFATFLHVSLFELLFRVFHVLPMPAQVVAQGVGLTTQFVGSRYYAFEAQAGRLQRQLMWWVICELAAYGLSLLVFKGLIILVPKPPELAIFASGAIIYFGFSYPIWNWVFKVTPEEIARSENVATRGVPEAPSQAGE